ncbi:hypothetical protein [Aliidiomarina indica]|uniref:hypothetical protein n=1 Tax=Aliidiomarina indica TaxID=2749147 RepID=UPI00188E57DE|nr:hypothetical protein [Aliidiomarina indica]
MKLEEVILDKVIDDDYLKNGDFAPLQDYLDRNPEQLQNERVKALFYGLLEGDIKRPKKRPKVQSKESKRQHVINLVFYFIGQGLDFSNACGMAAKVKGIGLEGNTVAKEYARPRFKKYGENPVKISERQAYFDGFIKRAEVRDNPELIKNAFLSIWGFELSDEEFELMNQNAETMGEK